MRSVVSRLRSHRRWTVPIAIIVLALAGGGYWLSRGDGAASASPATRLVSASSGTVQESVAATGTIEPAQQSALSFQVSGKVTSVRVIEGQHVAAGATLATLDSATLQAAVAQARANEATAQAKLASDTDAGAADTQLAADAASVTSAQGQVASARTSLSEAALTSPITGVVATMNMTVGQQVGSGGSAGGTGGSAASTAGGNSGSSSTSSGASAPTAQILVIGTSSWLVNATVDSTSIGRIAKGNQVQVVPGSTSRTVYGTIASIGIVSTGSSTGVATYPVVVDVTGTPTGMHAGDTATLSMIYRQVTGLVVPSLAVHTSNGGTYVNRMVDGKQVATPVSVGLSSGGTAQITAGLTDGDQVVVQVAPRPGVTGPSGATRSGGPRGGRSFGGVPGGGNGNGFGAGAGPGGN